MAASPIYPRTLAIGLALSAPSPTDPGIEVAASGYVRQVGSFALSNAQLATLTNPAALVWPRAAALWGAIGWLTAWTLDGGYAGFGGLVTVSDGVTMPARITVDAGDVARFAAGGLTLTDRNGPRLYGVGPYGVGPYSAGIPAPPRPFGRGSYGSGPYGHNPHLMSIVGVLGTAFAAEPACCPGAATWAPVAPCGGGVWTPAGPCGAASWAQEALP